MKTVRVVYELKITEDVPIGDYAEGSTLEQIREWEIENLSVLIGETVKNLGGQVTGVVSVEELA